MNNSKIAIDNVSLEIESPVDTTPILRQQATDLAQIVEAFSQINQSVYWKVLQKKVFDGVLESLYRRLRNEKNPPEMFALQGQIVWAEKYCDLTKLTEIYRTSLLNLTKQLNAKSD